MEQFAKGASQDNAEHNGASSKARNQRTMNRHASRSSNEFDRQTVANPETSQAGQTSGIPVWKSVVDIPLAILTAPVWLPLMFLVALGILAVAGRPLLFCQERVGLAGKRFRCLKFRSMKLNAETSTHERHLESLIHSDHPMTKLDAFGDPRLIPFGRILRATGLDELPQIINVLRREMSIVGPRPCTESELRRYQPHQLERLNALPGLTGYWQVNGKNKTTFSEMIAMDIHYVRNASPLMDSLIVLKTVPVLLAQVFETRLSVVRERFPSNPARHPEVEQ